MRRGLPGRVCRVVGRVPLWGVAALSGGLLLASALRPHPVLPERPAPTLIDLNAADARELAALPGVGPGLAAAVVAHRARHGRFRHAEDLLAVPRIGPRTLRRLRHWVHVRPQVTAGPDTVDSTLQRGERGLEVGPQP